MEFKSGDNVRVIDSENSRNGVKGIVTRTYDWGEFRTRVRFPNDESELYRNGELELVTDLPEKYEEVEVMGKYPLGWERAIFLCTNKFDENYKYITTDESGCLSFWDEMRRIQQPEEMTMEQICKELGRDIKIKK